MLEYSIGWILINSGILGAAAGVAALLFPLTVLQILFGSSDTSPATLFFARHWGALLFVVCSLTVYAGLFPDSRGPILTAAAIEKIIIVVLILFGKPGRTSAMVAIAAVDGLLAIVFAVYLITNS